MTLATIVPAEPGWSVISFDSEGPPFENLVAPVIAWRISADGKPEPITPLGIARGVFVRAPDGKVYDWEHQTGPFHTAEDAFKQHVALEEGA